MKAQISRLAPRVVGEPDPQLLFRPRYLLLGGDGAPSRTDLPCRWVVEGGQPFDAIIVADDRDAAAIIEVVGETRAWLAPVADLGRRGWRGADFRWNGQGADPLALAVAALDPIVRRLSQLPERIRSAESGEVLLLARAYCRKCVLDPVYAPETPEMVAYPAAGAIAEPWRLADRLVDQGAFRRRFFDRLHTCSACGSSRLNVREECSACRSPHLAQDAVIHHFRCAHQGLEREFRQGDRIVCPKCQRPLRHIGIDYDKPDMATVCATCGHVDAEAAIGFVCADCGSHQGNDRVGQRDWYGYEMTGGGERRLFGDDGEAGGGGGGDPGQTTLRGLVEQGLKIQARYGRPASVLALKFTATEQLRLNHGEQTVVRACRQAADVVRGDIRGSDVVAETEDGLVVYLPETSTADCDIPRRRLTERIRAALSVDLGVEISAHDLTEMARLIQR